MENTQNIDFSKLAEVIHSFRGSIVDASAGTTSPQQIAAIKMKLFGIQARAHQSDLPDKAYSA
jgi:hypothetical protein